MSYSLDTVTQNLTRRRYSEMLSLRRLCLPTAKSGMEGKIQ
jgi:hypothetical protein